MKRNLVLPVAGAVVLLAAIVLAAGGKLPWTGSRPADSCDIPVDIPDRVTASSSTSGGGIKVVDQGFSQSPSGLVSLGAVVENAGTDVAYRVPVKFRLFDAAHHELREVAAGEIPVLLPGQRIGAGKGTYARDTTVVTVETAVGPNAWLPPTAVGSLGPVNATYLRTLRYYPDNPAYVDVHYRETSTNCRALDSHATVALFRDPAGRIIGGDSGPAGMPLTFQDTHGNDIVVERQVPSSPSCSPGERETWVIPSVGGPVTGDDARTEVYPYCALGAE
ncbi:hypothetical protein ABZ342_11975 [Amycolatopsis sp. NPDC005961]|uniref:hypothetical protein n=1 Tax=Amycolatopsis sp. NPDC005961 TaxID=3156720 RepID=UPI0033D730E0